MKFYTEISRYYDYIFPVKKAQIDFLVGETYDTTKNILDIGCGSGGYTIKLSELEYNMTAIDLDEAMIDKLNTKNNNIDGRVLNMLDIDLLDKDFDMAYCIGNSLVHLNDEDEIFKFIEKTYEILNENSKFIIQIVNYDRILENNIKSLATIENEVLGLRFERHYDYLEDRNKIAFKTSLNIDGKTLDNEVLLYPIESDELIKKLKLSGFKNIKIYGNFNKDEYIKFESQALVLVGEK